jgi:hypothetical protein
MKFEVDFRKWLLWMLPAVLRKPRLIAFIRALTLPIVRIHAALLVFRVVANESAQITGQVCVLRTYLNRRFDPDGRIEIRDDEMRTDTYIYMVLENRPLYLNAHLSSAGGADFVVGIPAVLRAQEPEIRREINRFKLITKKFRIEYL